MKAGKIIILSLAGLAVIALAFWLGTKTNSAPTQEIGELREIALSQKEVIARMDSTIRGYNVAIQDFVLEFDQFRADQKAGLEKLTNLTKSGRAFQKQMLVELTSLDNKRNELAEEAGKFEY